MRFVHIYQFFRQFQLVVCHKPGKKYIIFDALSRLVGTNINSLIDGFATHSKLDKLFTYSTTLVEISPDLLKKIIKGYEAED